MKAKAFLTVEPQRIIIHGRKASGKTYLSKVIACCTNNSIVELEGYNPQKAIEEIHESSSTIDGKALIILEDCTTNSIINMIEKLESNTNDIIFITNGYTEEFETFEQYGVKIIKCEYRQ